MTVTFRLAGPSCACWEFVKARIPCERSWESPVSLGRPRCFESHVQGVRIPVISPSKGAPSVEVDFRVDFAANKDDMCAIGHSVERVVLHLAAVPP